MGDHAVKRGPWVGIDPGLMGAIAIVTAEREIELHDLPTVEAAGKNHIDVPGLVEILVGLDPQVVGVEVQMAMPAEKRSAVLKTGYGEGIIVGILGALRVPYTRVGAQEWQRGVFNRPNGDKGTHYLRAGQLFPGAELRTQRHGRADALLIAHYLSTR